MKKIQFTKTVQIPDLCDYEKRFPYHAVHASGGGKMLFEVIMQPESFIWAEAATILGRPAVAGIASKIEASLPASGKKRDYAKQFVGTLVCSLMEANGYTKAEINGRDKKKAVGVAGFTVGQMYCKS